MSYLDRYPDVTGLSRPGMEVPTPLKPWQCEPADYLICCSYCKRVRPAKDSLEGAWLALDEYCALARSETLQMSHGFCPECYQAIVQPMLIRFKKERA